MEKKSKDIIKFKYVTEKSKMLSELENAESNRSLRRCSSPKGVFIVDRNANKVEIANAIEAFYPGASVKKVNIINTKPKMKRRRQHVGYTSSKKKAIVTLREGCEFQA